MMFPGKREDFENVCTLRLKQSPILNTEAKKSLGIFAYYLIVVKTERRFL